MSEPLIWFTHSVIKKMFFEFIVGRKEDDITPVHTAATTTYAAEGSSCKGQVLGILGDIIDALKCTD